MDKFDYELKYYVHNNDLYYSIAIGGGNFVLDYSSAFWAGLTFQETGLKYSEAVFIGCGYIKEKKFNEMSLLLDYWKSKNHCFTESQAKDIANFFFSFVELPEYKEKKKKLEEFLRNEIYNQE